VTHLHNQERLPEEENVRPHNISTIKAADPEWLEHNGTGKNPSKNYAKKS